ncbi:MAG: OsmC family protein [Chloroflexota bacterium]|nr:OsmC family protein [Chloroflexota bacterium]
MANVKVTLGAGLKATIQTRDHITYIDEPVADGGTDAGPMATEALIGALAACAAITTRLYANRKGWALESVEIEVSRQRLRVEDYPDYDPVKHGVGDTINELRQRMTFTGDLTDEQRTRLLEIAGKCPVHRILTDPVAMIEELISADVTERAV